VRRELKNAGLRKNDDEIRGKGVGDKQTNERSVEQTDRQTGVLLKPELAERA